MTIEENHATAVHLSATILITFMSLKTPQFIRSIFKLYIFPLYTSYMYVKILINIHKCNLIIKNYIIFKALSFEYSIVI